MYLLSYEKSDKQAAEIVDKKEKYQRTKLYN